MERHPQAEAQVLALLDAYMAAFNARDVAGFDATFHFPTVRIASAKMRLIERGDHKPDMFEKGPLAEWDHSGWDRREVIHSSPDKVHLDCRFTRYRKDGGVIGSFDSIYVVTLEDGRWGIRLRSSFAP